MISSLSVKKQFTNLEQDICNIYISSHNPILLTIHLAQVQAPCYIKKKKLNHHEKEIRAKTNVYIFRTIFHFGTRK